MITKISIKNHKQHKIELLKLIAAVPHIPSASEKIENISKSDWFLSSDHPRVYREYLFNVLKPWFKHMENKYKTPARISNYWFQQYLKSDYHHWHLHPKCHFSSVYYVELPEKSLATEFKNYKSISVKEGDIITFPSHWVHRSPANSTGKRKTVIAFNSNMYIPTKNHYISA